MKREEAILKLKEKMHNANLIKHCLATEACLKELACYLGENEELWALAGLLHDIDYEETKEDPARHGVIGAEYLQGLGVPMEAVQAIRVHSGHAPAQSRLDWALLATDPLTGLIVAAALMHPSKKLANLDTEFIVRRYKEKRFAAGANREQIAMCSNLGLDLNNFIGLCLKGMQNIAENLGL